MADWRIHSQIQGDVVFFKYAPEGLEKNADEVFLWDLDKTYLDTKIDSLSGLLQTVMERAFQKKNIPGTRILLQNLGESWEQRTGNKQLPIYFITASPPQMEARILEKLKLDKIKPYGAFYKDNLRNLHPKRFWRLTKQVGYKLQALLQLRTRLREDIQQVLWGDDSESDAIIYNLYSDICARRISANELRHVLKNFFVLGEQTDAILTLQSKIPENDPVERIYINLAVDTDPDYYLKFGRRTLATYNTFQTALDLYQNKRLSFDSVVRVAEDMVVNYSFTKDQLMKSYDDLIRRHVLLLSTVQDLTPLLIEKTILTKSFKPSIEPIESFTESSLEPWVCDRIDYVNEYR